MRNEITDPVWCEAHDGIHQFQPQTCLYPHDAGQPEGAQVQVGHPLRVTD
jgi:hypothetical protein